MWIPRNISTELRQLARTFPVVALIGPRQVGKTSILEKSFIGETSGKWTKGDIFFGFNISRGFDLKRKK